MKIIVSSHSELALGLQKTLKFIGSEVDNIEFIILDHNGINNFEKKCKQSLDNISDEEVLVFVDIFGGTPYNIFIKEFLKRKIYGEIITGFNLYMILQAISSDNINEFITELKKDNGIKISSEELKNINFNEDDE